MSDARACRITKVTTYVVGARWRNFVFAHVETDEGISGIGEGSLEYQPKAVEAAIQQLTARYAIGRPAVRTEEPVPHLLAKWFKPPPDNKRRGARPREGDAEHPRKSL